MPIFRFSSWNKILELKEKGHEPKICQLEPWLEPAWLELITSTYLMNLHDPAYYNILKTNSTSTEIIPHMKTTILSFLEQGEGQGVIMKVYINFSHGDATPRKHYIWRKLAWRPHDNVTPLSFKLQVLELSYEVLFVSVVALVTSESWKRQHLEMM